MTKSNHHVRAALLSAFAALALLLTASAANASVRWHVESVHAPTTMTPGEAGQYIVFPSHVGDSAASGAVTLTDVLPPGVTASSAFGVRANPATGDFWFWDCPGLPASTVTCTLVGLDAQPPGVPFEERGRLPALFISVDVAEGATGTADNSVTLEGGGAAEPAIAIDATTFDATPAGFGFLEDRFVADVFDAPFPGGAPVRQAGAHPQELRVAFDTNLKMSGHPSYGPFTEPVASMRNLETRLPAGLVGNPEAAPKCARSRLSISSPANYGSCPADTQVGTIDLQVNLGPEVAAYAGDLTLTSDIPVFNLQPPKGAVAAFGFSFLATPVIIKAALDPSDHSVVATLPYATASLPVRSAEMTLWGVPGDPAHDALRADPDTANYGTPTADALEPFLTLPSRCDSGAPTTIRADSWEEPGQYTPWVSGAQLSMTGCDDPRFRFEPAISITPDTSAPDAPTGLDIELTVPQKDGAGAGAADLYHESGSDLAIATPPLRDATVTLPEGMSINAAGADGLQACTDGQLALGTDLGLEPGEPSCPAASRIGSVELDTPLLPDTVEGGVYVRSQVSDNPGSGDMFRLAIVIEDPERGLILKLPGRVSADPGTGRLVTSFEDNPQLPFSKLRLRFKGGARAPLATPPTCGTKVATTELVSWNAALPAATPSASFEIDCPGVGGFEPEFEAGAISPLAGAFSPFAVRIARSDGQQYLSGVSVEMPKGILAKLRGVEWCPDSVAADGSGGACPVGSRVGSATVAAGAGSPFFLNGDVFLTGPYRGGPYGLAVHIHAKAGPYDLGVVKVRQAIQIDPTTAAVSVVSDPLPQIVKGVPIRLRSVDVDVDRAGFTVNPTSCLEKAVRATLTSVRGAVRTRASRFRVSDCAALAFTPRLGMRLVGRRQMRSGGHPVLRARLSQGGGQANIRAAKVTLPPNLVLDSRNSVDPKLLCGYDASLKADCPRSSIIGKASLRTPLLNRPLSGPVHFVQGIRFENGNRIRTLPTLLIKLRGEVSIDLRSRTNTDRKDRLVSVFPNVPDARAARFNLQINGGRKGILVVTENRRGRINLCNRKQTALVKTDGHNGKRADYPIRVKTACAKKKRKR